jgi:hypothetical protein
MIRPQDDNVADTLRDQTQTAQDEDSHEELAQLAIGLQERQQARPVNFEDFTRLPGAHPDENPATRKDAHFTRELPRSKQRYLLLGGRFRYLDELQLTARDDKDAGVLGPGLYQNFVGFDLAGASLPGQAVELCFSQRWKQRVDVE